MIEIPDGTLRGRYVRRPLKPEDVVMSIKCGDDILFIYEKTNNEYTEASNTTRDWMEAMRLKYDLS